jgi:hypothetical protein
MKQQELRNMLSNRASELDYTVERVGNGYWIYDVYPYKQYGPPMQYRFREGE